MNKQVVVGGTLSVSALAALISTWFYTPGVLSVGGGGSLLPPETPAEVIAEFPTHFQESCKVSGTLLNRLGLPHVGDVFVRLEPRKDGVDERFALFGRGVADAQGGFTIEVPSAFKVQRGASGRTRAWVFPTDVAMFDGVSLSGQEGRAANKIVQLQDRIPNVLDTVHMGTVQLAYAPSIGTVEFSGGAVGEVLSVSLWEEGVDLEFASVSLADRPSMDVVAGVQTELFSWSQRSTWSCFWKRGAAVDEGVFYRGANNLYALVGHGDLIVDLPLGWSSTLDHDFLLAVYDSSVAAYDPGSTGSILQFARSSEHAQLNAVEYRALRSDADVSFELPPGSYRVDVWERTVDMFAPALQGTIVVVDGGTHTLSL
ncbi:hypothetical protein Pla163_10930 [Planctomycetes bacterium Pla163]|uniref:Uncharacterized protein n=1 Tax=Rohdeia mirabilis TaxID=2528008 RepID=A0A518CXN7_9BACT|nr:hypothetical protein Pla163_10930 [Planctomycetes bacterium Pla163]